MKNNTLTRPGEYDSLQMAIQYIPGVGPFRSKVLSKIDVATPEDLLYYFPRDHQDRRVCLIKDGVLGKKIAIRAELLSVQYRHVGRILGQARAILKDSSGMIDAIWFKRISYKYDVFSGLKKILQPGAVLLFYGQIVSSKKGTALRVEHCEPAGTQEAEALQSSKIVPIYPLKEGIQEKWLREITARVVTRFSGQLDDPLPQAILAKIKSVSLSEAVRMYHLPKNWEERDRARERLAFDEFFFLELALAIGRQSRRKESKGYIAEPSRKLLTPFRQQLQYEFTKAQSRVINEIFADMTRPSPMNRLLQGDVGSGKTVVALSAALLSIENGLQVAFLAPTEILAEQHALSMNQFFRSLPVKWALLTRSTPPAERKSILKALAAGKIDLLIGTHAILNDEVKYRQLGLVIVDEQHRFGVRQRERLVKGGRDALASQLDEKKPDVLIMTATPIPRTLALTLYGDLDVSVIDEMPKGRIPIHCQQAEEPEALQKISETVEKGQQVYLVLPLIEESEALAKKGKILRTAVAEYEKLQQRFPSYSIGLLHGQMPADEKKKIMGRFREGKVSILVATPVIEVGIDVPNATLIVIQNPERFGLAQLHQLRGRVGRGSEASTCLLVVDSLENQSRPRLDIFCEVADGFRLAEEDLKLRGPGEILGEAQHGVPFFKVGNLIKDRLLISQSREVARQLIDGEVALTMSEFRKLNRVLVHRFGNKIQLSNVG